MADVEQWVDPELEGLLRELGSRPRSVFLRSNRKDALRVLRSRTTEPLSGLAVSDSLERELVTVHRAELAEILKEACRTKLLEGEREKMFNSPYSGLGDRYEPTPAARLQLRLEHLSDSVVAGVDIVHRIVDQCGLGEFPVPELAALGHGLQPCDTWRLLAAFSLNSNMMPGSARALALTVVNGWPTDVDSIRALEALALSSVTEGRLDVALAFQEEAISIVGPYPLGEVNRLRCAMLLLDERRVLDASDRLAAMLSADHPLIAKSCVASLQQRRAGAMNPSPDTIRLALRLEPKMGEVAREVSRAFH